LITLLHLAISDFTIAANSSGELTAASTPASRKRCFMSARLSTRETSWFSLLMTGAGVLAGAHMPSMDIAS
jgi:hypothetical protein